MTAGLREFRVLVTGIDAAIARDVVRLTALEGGARVVAADKDAAKLVQLERDLGVRRAPVETVLIELDVRAETQRWERGLAVAGQRPQLLICCCGAPASGAGVNDAAAADDVALSDQAVSACPAAVAATVLRPALFLHAEPLRRSTFDRALCVLRHPTLRGVLERTPGRGRFDPERAIQYARIAADCSPQGGRMRLVPLPDPTFRPADAA